MVSPKLLLGFAALILLSGSALCSDAKASNAPPSGQDRPMLQQTRFNVIRMINAETVFIRKPFPVGEKGLVIKNGVITPNDEQLNFMLAQSGPAAKPGDRAKITDVLIKDRSIIVEINGGPRKKKKWYQHIEVGVGSSGNTVPVSTDTAENARGSFVAIVFDRFVPEISPDEIKKILAPVFDFNALNAVQDILAHVILQRPNRELQLRLGRNDIVLRPGIDRPDGNHCRLPRHRLAAHQRL